MTKGLKGIETRVSQFIDVQALKAKRSKPKSNEIEPRGGVENERLQHHLSGSQKLETQRHRDKGCMGQSPCIHLMHMPCGWSCALYIVRIGDSTIQMCESVAHLAQEKECPQKSMHSTTS